MPPQRPSPVALSGAIHILRYAHGFTTQESLAEALATDRSRVSKWLGCQVYPSPRSQEKLAAVFGMSRDEFLAFAWRLQRALEGEPETPPLPPGTVEIAGYGTRRRIERLSRQQMELLIANGAEMARPGGG